jgi:hypothetical protein
MLAAFAVTVLHLVANVDAHPPLGKVGVGREEAQKRVICKLYYFRGQAAYL